MIHVTGGPSHGHETNDGRIAPATTGTAGKARLTLADHLPDEVTGATTRRWRSPRSAGLCDFT
ncbi:MAG: hypothetical protein ABGX16_08175 [Pirellulales bacterium]